jgi:hypothetical protein
MCASTWAIISAAALAQFQALIKSPDGFYQ